MKNLFLYLLLCTTLVLACNSTQTSDSSPAVQEAWDNMMVVHDEIMPEMSTINKLKKKLRKMPQDSTVLQTITELTQAEKGMWDWMHNLTPQDQVNKMSEAEALEYLKKSTEEISEVKRVMEESIEKGEGF